MKGDFSRWTFDSTKHYTRVLSLQGRVFLDADFNEGQEIQLRQLRKLAADLLGPHAGPEQGFAVTATAPLSNDFIVKQGSYYVNGILCDNDADVKYSAQPHLPQPPALETGSFVVYLDVWERFMTYVEDEDRSAAEMQQTIREVALGGPDTAARSKVVWQLRLLPLAAPAPPTNSVADYNAFINQLEKSGVIRLKPGKLKARARKPRADDLPCSTSPGSRYRGPENQLYRVEIHTSGTLPPAAGGARATFKWSRENGSVIFPIRSIEGPMITVESVGRDDRLGLKPGDWVEIVDDEYVLQSRAEPPLKVKSVGRETFVVELSAAPASLVGTIPTAHPILRRWEGTAPVSLNAEPDSGGFLHLEDGVEVRFANGEYRTGDYWIIPARTATGDVEWPGPVNNPLEIAPHGIVHAYAPLAFINVGAGAGNATVASSMRRTINQLWS